MLSLPTVTVGLTEELTNLLLVGALVLLVSVAAVRLATRSGLPTLLLYLAIGMALGEAGFGISFENSALAHSIGLGALVLILSEGGLTTEWDDIKSAILPAALLSTIGVVVSVAVVAGAAYYLLDLPWSIALLLGAILASTDAAAVFSVLRRVPLPRRLSGVLEAESGFNDAPVVLLVVALASQATPGVEHQGWWVVGVEAALELAGGAIIGLVLGQVLGRLLRWVAPGSSGLFSLAVVAVTVLAYAVGDLLHSSGFLATYVCALVLGNLKLPHRQAFRGISQAFGWLAQIGLFVMLGLLASPGRLVDQIIPALVIGTVLLLVARPLSVLASLAGSDYTLREQAFLSWSGLRGAVPVVLATVPLTLDTPGTSWMFDLVFVLVIIFTLVQAPTLPWITRVLGLEQGTPTYDVDVESTALDDLDAHLLQASIGPASKLHGVEVFELRLPPGADVTLIVRDGDSFVPERRTVLRHGDQMLVVTTAQSRSAALKRIQAISRDGRLAGWHSSGEG
ncbi:potassium/proton antiporter [Demetria terragena]|uniref:potassium/proton antiporter n=1 Tax=Demetria terragena TaxID=63959 RepID=UPI00037E2648|nr:potassium/proton antiporter [Demetria terragena]